MKVGHKFDIKKRLIQLGEMLEGSPEFYSEKKKELSYFTSTASLKESIQFCTTEIIVYLGLFFGVGIISYATSVTNKIMWAIINGTLVPFCIWLACFGIVYSRIRQLKRWRIETRLSDLEELRECNLITNDEYISIRKKLLEEGQEALG